MVAIGKNHKNGYQDSIIQQRNLQKKQNTTKFGSIFNLNMLSAILDVSYDPQNQLKLMPWLYHLEIFGTGFHPNIKQHICWSKMAAKGSCTQIRILSFK